MVAVHDVRKPVAAALVRKELRQEFQRRAALAAG